MHKKSFVQGMLLMLVLVIIIPGTFASNVQQAIEVLVNQVNVKLNGESVGVVGENYVLEDGTEVPFSFVYKGTTYMAVRKLSETLGLEVGWDGDTSTIIINESTSSSTDEQANNFTTATRTNPLGIGEEVEIYNQLDSGNAFKSTMSVLDVIRGEAAWKMVYDANSFNHEPGINQEYVVINFAFKLLHSDDPNVQYPLSKFSFTLVSADGKDYPSISVVPPKPELTANLYQGAYHEGYLVYLVDKDDKLPLLTTGRFSDGSGGAWFKAYKEASETNSDDSNPTDSNDSSSTTTLNSKKDILDYLNNNYSRLDTSMGPTTFTFDILENDSTFSAYDYWIQVEYDLGFFIDVSRSIKYSIEDRNATKEELKEHMKKMGLALTELTPDKKLYGGYYDFWYTYPYSKVGLNSRMYYSWTNYNYDYDVFSDVERYYQSTPDSFRWYNLLDDEL